MPCQRCHDTGSVGLESLPMPCPHCAEQSAVTNVTTLPVRSPHGFARLCAHIGYTDGECVAALVSRTALSADDARQVVEEEYSHFAEREAAEAVEEFEARSALDTSDGD